MKRVYVIEITERYHYEEDVTCYYAEEFEDAEKWVKENFNVEVDGYGNYVEEESNTMIKISSAVHI